MRNISHTMHEHIHNRNFACLDSSGSSAINLNSIQSALVFIMVCLFMPFLFADLLGVILKLRH